MIGRPRFGSMHRQVLLSAATLALFQATSMLVMTVGGLAGTGTALALSWLGYKRRRFAAVPAE